MSHTPNWHKQWRRLLSRYCSANLDWLNYSREPLGYQPLREAITRYLNHSRAVNCKAEQILITNGTQQALDLILRLLIEPALCLTRSFSDQPAVGPHRMTLDMQIKHGQVVEIGLYV